MRSYTGAFVYGSGVGWAKVEGKPRRGCRCDVCVQLDVPGLGRLAEAMAFIGAAVVKERLGLGRCATAVAETVRT